MPATPADEGREAVPRTRDESTDRADMAGDDVPGVPDQPLPVYPSPTLAQPIAAPATPLAGEEDETWQSEPDEADGAFPAEESDR